ncbi:2-oxo-4-hydroxy-4-carboxy-5-ureidoimidazoline decarboxylase [Rhodoferax sp.]|uniref:2-oxo-4-hydroxy-4-carboxy-5-ureidoimidazoline decarboxylase n=1 Tax=Rhodoferax sp. TaxID=50421 RepID=UPI002842A75C|nr:2-oxo-4-hydroxy-4-carboxy-5-ureidoimidazoline decarboxylase [Rhodoferax sp.]MDR3367788.1 2-oxo-4-hydroxy-4-carboxy-5-ureidoimidazoline decarboxylase [Rhodoferax sp.]
MPLTLSQLNAAPAPEALSMLDGLYEHSPWIAEAALQQRPFQSVAQLKYLLTEVLDKAGRKAQIALIRAHPELAGKAMVSQSLTAESTNEQSKAGLTNCSAEEFARLQQLNAEYNAKFGWPFILAVRGPRGTGLSRAEIIATFERRLHGHPDFELQECLRNIHRIAEIRLNDKFGLTPTLGNDVWDWQEALSEFSEPGFAEQGQLTVTYLSDAHRACAARIQGWMLACGFDSAHIDAVGNVVGRYEALANVFDTSSQDAISNNNDSYLPRQNGEYSPKTLIKPKTLLTGSHYDTVRNAGKYDGRLGIFVPMACVRELHRAGRRLPFAIEVVAFAEEEGQRFKATFLGSGALTGDFNPEWLDQLDADGISMWQAMQHAVLCPSGDKAAALQAIAALKRDPTQYMGFVEVHIEQGPVLNALNLPLGVVTAINASVRYVGEVIGTASHAGTTPMNQRQDAACAVAELALYLEQRAAQDGDSVATMGQLNVPAGSINVVPGRCSFSLDLRAPNDLQRNALEGDVLQKLEQFCTRRGVRYEIQPTMRVSAAPSAPEWQQRWEAAVTALGLPVHRLPSGAGHDAMKLHEVMPQAMLFVRGQNAGISHNPLESTTSDDMQLAVEAFAQLLEQLAGKNRS